LANENSFLVANREPISNIFNETNYRGSLVVGGKKDQFFIKQTKKEWYRRYQVVIKSRHD
jgi:hypothetical protein